MHFIACWIRFVGSLRNSELWFWITFIGQVFGAVVMPALVWGFFELALMYL